MDATLPYDIEFLELNDLEDNHERNKILTYLHSFNENIQLPWKVHSRPIEYQPVYSEHQMCPPLQLNQPQYNPNPVVYPEYYNSPQYLYPEYQPQYEQQQTFVPIILNHSTVIAQEQSPFNLTDLGGDSKLNYVQQNGMTVSLPPQPQPQFHYQQQEPQYQPQIQFQPQPQPQPLPHPPSQPQPQRKSWATLFKSPTKVETREVNGNALKSPAGDQEKNNNNDNNNENVCPFKYPRKVSFIDPNCYRMGEFLVNHTVEVKTISLQPRGLINRSNYCYINSILQALLACPPLYNLLSGLAEQNTSNEKQKPTPIIDGMCHFVKQFQHLPAGLRVRRFDKNQKKDQSGVSIDCDPAFEPGWIYKMLNGIRSDSFLVDGSQEDAEEFLGCLLNGLNDEMLELMKLVKADDGDSDLTSPNNSTCDFVDEWKVMGPKNKGSVTRRTDIHKTPISNIFGGFLKSRIHRAGDQSTDNIQPFFTLQLNIEKVKTVREALESLVAKNHLEGVTSSKTNEEVEAWQQVTLEELPKILVLHLKCFDFKLNGCTKIMKALEFPIDLKIDSRLLSTKSTNPKERQYKLFAIVYHDGKEATKGHYVTDAFHVGYSSWLRYDDASVKLVQEEQVLNPQGTRVPYLLFYRRIDTIRSK